MEQVLGRAAKLQKEGPCQLADTAPSSTGDSGLLELQSISSILGSHEGWKWGWSIGSLSFGLARCRPWLPAFYPMQLTSYPPNSSIFTIDSSPLH